MSVKMIFSFSLTSKKLGYYELFDKKKVLIRATYFILDPFWHLFIPFGKKKIVCISTLDWWFSKLGNGKLTQILFCLKSLIQWVEGFR